MSQANSPDRAQLVNALSDFDKLLTNRDGLLSSLEALSSGEIEEAKVFFQANKGADKVGRGDYTMRCAV
jgi:hypothetical protein